MNRNREFHTTPYTAKKELEEIKEFYLETTGKDLPTWKIVDHAIKFLHDDVDARRELEND